MFSSLIIIFSFLTLVVIPCSLYKISLNPTFGGSNPGVRAEIVHSVREELSLICGCALATHPSAYASVSVSIFVSVVNNFNVYGY